MAGKKIFLSFVLIFLNMYQNWCWSAYNVQKSIINLYVSPTCVCIKQVNFTSVLFNSLKKLRRHSNRDGLTGYSNVSPAVITLSKQADHINIIENIPIQGSIRGGCQVDMASMDSNNVVGLICNHERPISRPVKISETYFKTSGMSMIVHVSVN